jgi:O-antigen ligase
MRNLILFISIFLFALFNLLGDFFLQLNLPGITQGQVASIFIIISFFNFKIVSGNRFLFLCLIVLFVTIIFFILDGFKNISLLYTILGSVLLGIAAFNVILQKEIIRYSFLSFMIVGVFGSLAYYFGFWSFNSVTMRSNFAGNNENILAGLLVFSYSISLFYYNKEKILKERLKYLFISLVHIVPLLETGSRSGFLILVISTICVLFVRIPIRFRKIFIFLSILIIAIVSTIGISIQDSDSVFSRFKNLGEDDRFAIWSVANNLILNNLLTGVGFGNFNNEDWRIANDLFFIRPGSAPNLVNFNALSLHNSFLDLILIGGIWLLIPYLLIILNLILKSMKFIFSVNKDLQKLGAFILPIVLGIFIFSFGGQGATDKYTWFQFGICYLLIWQAKSRIVKQNNRVFNENRN